MHSNLGIKWQDHISNKEVLKRASLPSLESILLQVQLHRAGHVTRMKNVCMPKAVFFSELQEGKCHHGGPWRHYKDQLNLKRQLAQAEISHQSWQQEASDWDSWCSSWEKPAISLRQRGMKPQRKNAGGRVCSIPIILIQNLHLSKVQ